MLRKGVQQFSDFLCKLYADELHESDEERLGARSVTIQVTDSCNLRCSYCYQINKHENFISLDDAKKFIDMILEGDNEYCPVSSTLGFTLEFIGGEPFLAIDLVSEITHYTIMRLYELNHPWLYRFRISFSSNGTLYFDPKVQEYLRRYQRFVCLGISVDGNKELHDSCRKFPDGSGSYDKAIAAVKHYRRTYHQEANTKMTLAPSNVAYTFEAIKNLIENDYHDINLNCVFEEGWTKQDANTLYYQLKKIADYVIDNKLYGENGVYISRFEQVNYQPMDPEDDKNFCGGLGNMIAINPSGKIYPCIRYMESSLGTEVPEVIIGDVCTGIMKNDKYAALVNEMKSCTRKSQSTEECFYCPIASGCAWCSGYAYQYYKSFGKRTTFICDTHKAEALACLYYWNRFYLETDTKDYRINHVPKEWALEIIPEEEWNMLVDLEARAKEHSGLTEEEAHDMAKHRHRH